jgi:hypothetical protein
MHRLSWSEHFPALILKTERGLFMNTFKKTVFAFIVLGILAFPAFAGTLTGQQHLDKMAHYESLAKDQDETISEHRKMRADYGKDMREHCDAIIKDAMELKDEYLVFAKWHKMQASELEGK